jgi:high-affinity iron transporter
LKSIGNILLLLILSTTLFAQGGEQSRILVHTLNYISHDYQFAVANGKVISKDEYDEELEFAEAADKYFKQYASQWSDKDSVEIGLAIQRLDSLIDAHAEFKDVSALATETKSKVIAASGLTVVPGKYPDLRNGKVIFRTECSKCHGQLGYGDGPEGKDLDPKPRNFQDNVRMKTISPFTAFNTIRLGIEGTGMKAHPTLSDEEVWDVAFYVVALRYQPLGGNPFLKDESTTKFLAGLNLSTVSSSSDEDFIASLKLNDTTKANLTLAAIRLNQPKPDESEFVNTSLKYLDGAMELYLDGRHDEAAQLAALSYLEGIEPIEKQLKATDPQVMERLEDQMQALRKMMDDNRPAIEVKDSLNAVRATVGQLNDILNKKNYSFWLAFLLAGSVLLREGLEAFLVILVLLSVLKSTELVNYKRWIHAGWLSALLLGVALWLFGGEIMKQQTQHIELIEGVISIVAVAMLLYVGFWLHGKSEMTKWRDYVNKLVKGVVSNKSLVGLAGLSFFVVFREVFESVLFLSALNIESGGKQSNAIVLGVLAALVIVLALASLVLKFSTKLPIPKLFKISSFVMALLAVVLTGKGVHSFQVMSIIPVHGLSILRFELLGIFPTIESFGAQILVLAVVVVMWNITMKPHSPKA